jgi:hypothetical protein
MIENIQNIVWDENNNGEDLDLENDVPDESGVKM